MKSPCGIRPRLPSKTTSAESGSISELAIDSMRTGSRAPPVRPFCIGELMTAGCFVVPSLAAQAAPPPSEACPSPYNCQWDRANTTPALLFWPNGTMLPRAIAFLPGLLTIELELKTRHSRIIIMAKSYYVSSSYRISHWTARYHIRIANQTDTKETFSKCQLS